MIVFELSMKIEVLAGAPTPSASWPNGLPQKFLLRGFGHTSESGAVRSAVDQGPAFQRPRFSVPQEVMTPAIAVTQAQLNAFWNWYHGTLRGGALPFTHKHPLSGDTVVMRFDVSDEPKSRIVTT